MLGSVRGVVSNDHSYRDKANPRVPTLFRARKATRFGRTIARSERPGVVEEPGMCRSSLDGNREIPSLASCGALLWPASGRRGAVADDERTWEVRLRNSSWEADEQSRATGCGVGGAKCGGRGECEPAKHAPGAGPGKCVTGAGAHTASRKATEEGTVHLALPPYQRRTTPGGILRPQARCRTGCGWADMAGLRGGPRSQDRGPARPGPSGSISGSAVSATLHTEGGWAAAPARNCDAPGIMHLMQFALGGLMGEDEPSLRPIFAGVDPHCRR